MSSKTQWRSRTVIDTRGDAGSIILDDWLYDYYDGLDADDMAWVADTAIGMEITYEDKETLLGGYGIRVEYDSEWSAEHATEAVYEYLAAKGERVTMSRTSVSLGAASLALGDDRGESGDEALAGAWWRCGNDGEGWITDEADVEIAAEYLYAAAHDEN